MHMPCLHFLTALVLSSSTTAQWLPESLSQPRTELAAVGHGDRVYFAGGTTDDGFKQVYSDVVDVFNTTTGAWTTATLSQGRYRLAAGAVGNKVMFGGGFSSDLGTTALVDILDTSTGVWSVSSLAAGRASLAAASVGTKVLFAGGGGTSPSSGNLVDIYDDSTGTWTVDLLSQPRFRLSGVAAGGKAFFAGGVTGLDVPSDVVDIYDASTGTWSIAHLSEPRYDMAAASVGSKVLFAGGYANTAPFFSSATVDIYDMATESWSTASLSQGRYRLAGASLGVRAFFGGGFFNPFGQGSDRVDVYDAATDSWLTSSLNAPRQSLASASAGGHLLFAGGHNNAVAPSLFSLADVFVGSADCDGDTIADWDAVLAGIAPDCNANGIPDFCDIGVWDLSADCNDNDSPDECEPDLDGDGVPDDCVQVLSVTGALASNPIGIAIEGKAFEVSSTVSIGGEPQTVVLQTPTGLVVSVDPHDPGLFDLSVTNSVSMATVQEGAELWPSLMASTTGVGGMLNVTLDNGTGGLYVLALALGSLPARIPIASPPTWYGVLLNPAAPLFILGTGAFAASDPVALSYPVPDDPALSGLALYLQAWCQQGFFGAGVTYSFTNMAAVTL